MEISQRFSLEQTIWDKKTSVSKFSHLPLSKPQVKLLRNNTETFKSIGYGDKHKIIIDLPGVNVQLCNDIFNSV